MNHTVSLIRSIVDLFTLNIDLGLACKAQLSVILMLCMYGCSGQTWSVFFRQLSNFGLYFEDLSTECVCSGHFCLAWGVDWCACIFCLCLDRPAQHVGLFWIANYFQFVLGMHVLIVCVLYKYHRFQNSYRLVFQCTWVKRC